MIALIGIYRRELGRVFAGSACYLALPVAMAWMAWQRLFGQTDPAAVDGPDAVFRALAAALVPLAVWAAAPSLSVERAERTATLWAISPVRPTWVLLGKFGALMTALAVALAPLSLALLPGMPDGLAWPRLASGLGGLLLVSALAVALTLLASALVTHFSTAFTVSLALLAGWVWGPDLAERALLALGAVLPGPWIGWGRHAVSAMSGWDGSALLQPLFVGWVDLGAVAALAAGVIVLLVVTQQVVASERWRG